MHELGIARSIVRIVQRHLPVDHKVRVKRVKISVGELSAVVPEFLETWYEVASRGSGAEGSRLDIEKARVVFGCLDCRAEFEAGRYVPVCPDCFGRVAPLAGQDIQVIEIETLEDEAIDMPPERCGPEDWKVAQ
jgi:hydrogenase nickel incorporation protein HypA/HybF